MSRHVALEGAHNFRSLHGYRGTWGPLVRGLYRSDDLGSLTADDADRLLELGLRTVLDLRSEPERAHRGPGVLRDRGLPHHSAPFNLSVLAGRVIDGDPLDYVVWVEHVRAELAQAFEILDEAEWPLVFHCTAGKDRTGIVAALVLALSGVDRATIVQDYTRTRELSPLVHLSDAQIAGWNRTLAASGDAFVVTRPMLDAPPHAMERFLDDLAGRYGGPRGLLRDVGVPTARIDRVEARLRAPHG